MADIVKMKEELKKIYGDKLEGKLKEIMTKEGCTELRAVVKLVNITGNIDVPVTTMVGEFSPSKIADIKADVLDDVQELVDAGVKDIDAEMKKGKWRDVIVLCLGMFGKEKTYETKGVTEMQRKVGLLDPTGYLEGTIWRTVNVERLAPLLEVGKVMGLSSVITTYYHPHEKVAVNLNAKTGVVEVDDKVDRTWIKPIEDIAEYDVGIVEISDVMVVTEKKYRGCNNPKCPESFKSTKAPVCKHCANETEELITRTYPALSGEYLHEFSIPPWTDLTLSDKGNSVVVVRRKDSEHGIQYTVIAKVDDFVEKQSGEVFHKSGSKEGASPKIDIEEKIDTTNIEVDKKVLVRIKQMISSMPSGVQEGQISGIANTMELKPEVLAKGLDMHKDVVKEGSTWKLKTS
jgi:hypothetical protein